MEDYNSISRGFNLHPPYPNPFNETVSITFNIFHPGYVKITIRSLLGQKIATLLEDEINNLGIHKLQWTPVGVASGQYYVVMRYGDSMQERSILYLK